MREYIGILASIRDKGLEPMLTLYHWPTPAHLLKIDTNDNITAGAWEHIDVLTHFRFYMKNVVKYLSDKDFIREVLQKNGFSKEKQDKLVEEGLVRYFISINEPINLLLPTYVLGLFPPFKKFRFDLIKKVMNKVVEAHDIAIDEIRNSHLPAGRGPLKIGAAHNWTFFEGLFSGFSHSLINSKLARKFEEGKNETDFVGLHYYFRMKLSPFNRSRKVYGDNPYFGDVHPPGILKVLKEMNKEYPGKDIFITEFGFSDSHGLRRPFWILETMRHVIEALEQDIPVKGMLLWTLVNNFEWNLGVHQKFGLFDEGELDNPLVPSEGEGVKSWEAWQAGVNAFLNPSKDSLSRLQSVYERARHQFHTVTSKKKGA
jgi:beta-glucosidase